jgi:hypothetical protein
MNSLAIIGIGAGLVSAVLFLSTATGSLLAMMLFFVVALPGFIAGLGWGSLAALIAGLSAAATVAAIFGPAAGLVYLFVLGVPVTLLTFLALLARKPDGHTAGEPAKVEWFPPGRLVAWSTLIAGCVAALSVPMLGFDAATYRASAKSYFDKTIFSHLPTTGSNAVNREQLEPLIDLLVQVLPATSAMVWLAILLTNMWAAGRIIEASGRAIRPCPPLGALTYPRHFPLGFVASLLASFTPGIAGIIATGFAGAFLFAYILMGLVVLHVLARQSAFSGLLLTILYLAMLFMGWVTLLVAVIGLGEPVFKLRERVTGGAPPPQDKDD